MHVCLIIVVIFLGLGGAEKGRDHFHGGVDLSRKYVKILMWQLEVGYVGLNGQQIGKGKVLYLIQLFLHYILYGETFIG